MRRQIPFSETRWPMARKSRLNTILDAVDRIVDWGAFTAEIRGYPLPNGKGRRPVPLQSMLRIHTVAWLTGANDRQTEELLIDLPCVCGFCLLDDTGARPPDAETIGNFRRRLERDGLSDIVHRFVGSAFTKKGISLMPGEIVEPRTLGAPL